MSTTVTDLLDDLSDTLTNKNFDQASDISYELQQYYENKRGEELDTVNRASALLSDPQSVSTDNIQELQGMKQIDGSTRMVRTILFMIVSALDESHAELKQEGELKSVIATAQSAIEELKTAEPERSSVSNEVQGIINNSDVPASLILRKVAIEEQKIKTREYTEITIAAENVGEQPATDVELVLNTSENVDLEENKLSIGKLDPSQSFTRSVKVGSSKRGRYTIDVQIKGQTANPDRSSSILIVESDETETWYELYVNENDVVTTSGLNKAVRHYLTGKLSDEKLNTIVRAYLTGAPIEE